jgi:cytochrome bd-type quinol oxidase subunit 2
MIQKMKRTLLASLAAFALLVPAAVPAMVSAQDIQDGLCAGSELSTQAAGNCDSAASGAEAAETVDTIIETVINIFSLVVGVVSVIMIIVGGLKYITSGGDSGNVSGAKNTILYAIIGLVVVALAQVIVQFVLGRVTE